MRLSDLLPQTGIRSNHSPEAITVCGVSDHTGRLEKGMLFIAKQGRRTNAVELLQEIEEKGAAAILLAEGAVLPRETDVPCFYASDLPEAEAEIWERYYGNPASKLRIFGVTGTNGKTGTAEFLAHILNESGIPTAYIGTLGTCFKGETLSAESDTMTTPIPSILYRHLRWLLDRGAEAVVMEVSSHAASQGRVRRLCFESLLFTNLTEDHLDYHKTMEAYYLAKRSLFRQARLAIVNRDDDYGERLLSELSIEKRSIAVIEDADYTVRDLHENGYKSTHYTCVSSFGELPVSYPFFGAFQVYNTLLAIAAALCAGVCPEQVRWALLTLNAPKGRLEVLPTPKGFTVIVDYAHTPDAFEAAIKTVKRRARGRLFVLFGAGGEREQEKRPKMGRIAVALSDHAFITEDNPRSEDPSKIIDDILSGIEAKGSYTVIPDRKQAIERALDTLKAGDTLLLLGKGHEEYIIRGEEKLPFSERQIVHDYLKKKVEG